MTLASDPTAAPRMSASRMRLVTIVFTASVFLSALLLFGVQPMFTRMVLPRLGGSPSVWSVAMVFFQSMLLAGYAYAHFLARMKAGVAPVLVHLAVLIAGGLMLPLSIAASWGTPPSQGEALWLIGLFVVSIGPPFFALSANNPLLQHWFVRTGHPAGADPYFLYASSNIGSFLALLAYPVLLEPAFTLRAQGLQWTVGYWLLVVLVGCCGLLMLRAGRAGHVEAVSETLPAAAPGLREWGIWTFLAAVPSGLLVAVTAHISTDVAAAPLLWVLPLSLYLLTWVLVFQRRPLIPHRFMLAVQPLAVVAIVVMLAFGGDQKLALMLTGHLLAFFVIAMAAHGELARQRPAPAHLTKFYVALSAGGMIGGLFTGLVAPFTFSWIAEYPILTVLAALCRPVPAIRSLRRDNIAWAILFLLTALLLVPGFFFGWHPYALSFGVSATQLNYAIAFAAVCALLFVEDPRKFAFAIAVVLDLIRVYPSDSGRTETVRSFFGVHKVVDTPDGQYRVLMHGTTIHGAQRLRDAAGKPVEGRPEPISYYEEDSAISRAIAAVRAHKKGPLKVAVVGLGSGSIACRHQPGDDWKFFEIDQSIVDIAKTRFGFLKGCNPDVPIVLGDARLTFAKEAGGAFDIIVVDAYSSDAIPIDLATREAMAIYKDKLTPEGAVLMHVSNRHLELASVVVGICEANGMKAWHYDADAGNRDDEYVFPAEAVLCARDAAHVPDLSGDEDWELEEPDAGQRVWTDDYSNVLGAVIRRKFD